MSQLALPRMLDDHALFETYWPAGNETAVAYLAGVVAGHGVGCWLWGAPATGKTHLLQAACARRGDRSIFLPLGDLLDAGPAVLDGLASRGLVCIDDVDRAAGRDDWELALFTLWNAASESGTALVVAAASPPRESAFVLPDLSSRLAVLPAFHLQPLDEDERPKALRLRANHRGLDLPDDTARFLLNRSRRDMASLYELLDRLDVAALEAQRRLTIPFVREIIAGASGGRG